MDFTVSYQIKDFTPLKKEQIEDCVQKFIQNEEFQHTNDASTERYIFRFIHRHIKTTVPKKIITHTISLRCNTRPMTNEKVFIPLIQKSLRIFEIVHHTDRTVLELEPFYDRYETYISETAKKITSQVLEEIKNKKEDLTIRKTS